MTRITNNMLAIQMLTDINNVRSQMMKSQLELSSGKKISKPSDDPNGTGAALNVRAQIARNNDYLKTGQFADGWLSTADSAMQGILDEINTAKSTAVQGNGAVDQPARDALADQIDQIIDNVKGTMNAQYGGQYVFAGTKTTTAPYQNGPVDTYNGNTTQISQEIAPNTSVTVGTIGQAVVGDGTTGLIKNLRDLSVNLRAGNTNAIQTSIGALTTDSNTVLSALSANGAIQNRVEAASNRLSAFGTSLEMARSDAEDADFAKSAIDYNTQATALQAALQSAAQLSSPTLLDYLK